MKLVRLYDICWDVSDDDDGTTTSEDVGLPSEVIVIADDNWDDADDEAADLLSDKFGYCVEGCSFEVVQNVIDARTTVE